MGSDAPSASTPTPIALPPELQLLLDHVTERGEEMPFEVLAQVMSYGIDLIGKPENVMRLIGEAYCAGARHARSRERERVSQKDRWST